jgi:hypothetical protein
MKKISKRQLRERRRFAKGAATAYSMVAALTIDEKLDEVRKLYREQGYAAEKLLPIPRSSH